MSLTEIGVQMGAHSVFEQGAPAVIDRLVGLAGVNSIQVNAYDYYGWNPELNRSPVSVRWTPQRYAHLPFSHADDTGMRFAGRDVLDELIPPAHAYGVQVHARILEGFRPATSQLIPGFSAVQQVDALGRRDTKPCWNHPDYRAWWLATIDDLVREHDLDGLLLGPERDGPLGPLMHNAQMPTCFCEHCQIQARKQGIDVNRAKRGMLDLHTLIAADSLPGEGMQTAILRHWISHPEILHWERLQSEAKWSLHAEIASLARSVRPGMQIGLHICMYGLVWDFFARATTDYRQLAGIFDYLKPSTYFDVNAARLHGWIGRSVHRLHRGMRASTVLPWLLEGMGHDPRDEPDFDALATGRLSPAWIRREIARCVTDCGGKCRVLSGIGVDIPHSNLAPITADELRAAVIASFDGGADGLLLSREYEFMRDESLAAIDSAVRALSFSQPHAPAGR